MKTNFINCLTTTTLLLVMGGCATYHTEPPKVQQQYALTDEDGDGVIDAREQCKGSIRGAEVDNYGCGSRTDAEIDMTISMFFEHDSYQLDQDDTQNIAALARYLELNPGTEIVIEGHTSKVGSKDYNVELSKKRAAAVLNYLQQAMPQHAARIRIESYGFEKLRQSGQDEEAHKYNRRVVVKGQAQHSEQKLKWTIYTPENEANPG